MFNILIPSGEFQRTLKTKFSQSLFIKSILQCHINNYTPKIEIFLTHGILLSKLEWYEKNYGSTYIKVEKTECPLNIDMNEVEYQFTIKTYTCEPDNVIDFSLLPDFLATTLIIKFIVDYKAIRIGIYSKSSFNHDIYIQLMGISKSRINQ